MFPCACLWVVGCASERVECARAAEELKAEQALSTDGYGNTYLLHADGPRERMYASCAVPWVPPLSALACATDPAPSSADRDKTAWSCCLPKNPPISMI